MGTRDMLESGEVGEVTEACVEEVFSQATLHIRHAFTAATQQRSESKGQSVVIGKIKHVLCLCVQSPWSSHGACDPSGV